MILTLIKTLLINEKITNYKKLLNEKVLSTNEEQQQKKINDRNIGPNSIKTLFIN